MMEAMGTGQIAYFMSVIIAVYDDWKPLARCLRALAQQTECPCFEVLVINDGSTESVPDSILNWSGAFSFKVLSQPHSGTAAARNLGIRYALGDLLLFIDADSIPQGGCFAALASCVAAHPASNYFQLHLAGEPYNLPGRAEELRLVATQDFLLQSDGLIQFLNTAGFAVRRSSVNVSEGLFDEHVLRGEDTLLLATLLRRNQLPRFVRSAVVRHAIDMSIAQCLWKDVRSALMEAKMHAIISGSDVSVRVSHSERIELLHLIWKISSDKSIGRAACFLLIARQTVRLVILAICQLCFGFHRGTVARF